MYNVNLCEFMCRRSYHSPVFSAQKVTLVFPKVLEFNNIVFNFFMIRPKEKITLRQEYIE